MKFLYDHYSKYLKKDDTKFMFRFTNGLGDSILLKENKQSNLACNDGRLIMKMKANNNNKKKESHSYCIPLRID